MALAEFYLFELSLLWVLAESVLQLQKFRWMSTFNIKIVIFSIFVQKVNFKRS